MPIAFKVPIHTVRHKPDHKLVITTITERRLLPAIVGAHFDTMEWKRDGLDAAFHHNVNIPLMRHAVQR